MAIGITVVVFSGCASGPTYRELSSTFPALDHDHGRIFFLRDDDFAGGGVRPEIHLNGVVVGHSRPGAFFYVDEPPGEYTVSTTTEVERKITFPLAGGQTRYVKTEVSMGFFIGHVTPSVIWPETALPELSDLHYDDESPAPSAPTTRMASASRATAVPAASRPTSTVSEVTRTTASGAPLLLSSHASWDSACQSTALPTISIVQAPAHGTMRVEEGDVVIRNSAAGKCVGSTVHGMLVSYVSDKTYSGVDQIRYTSSAAPRLIRKAVIDVTPATASQ